MTERMKAELLDLASEIEDLMRKVWVRDVRILEKACLAQDYETISATLRELQEFGLHKSNLLYLLKRMAANNLLDEMALLRSSSCLDEAYFYPLAEAGLRSGFQPVRRAAAYALYNRGGERALELLEAHKEPSSDLAREIARFVEQDDD